VVSENAPFTAFGYNFCMQLVAVLSICIAGYSTYITLELSTETEETIMSTLKRFGYMSLYCFSTWFACILVVVAVTLKACLDLERWQAAPIAIANVLVLSVFHHHHFQWQSDARAGLDPAAAPAQSLPLLLLL
jgi:hypothetical protein